MHSCRFKDILNESLFHNINMKNLYTFAVIELSMKRTVAKTIMNFKISIVNHAFEYNTVLNKFIVLKSTAFVTESNDFNMNDLNVIDYSFQIRVKDEIFNMSAINENFNVFHIERNLSLFNFQAISKKSIQQLNSNNRIISSTLNQQIEKYSNYEDVFITSNSTQLNDNHKITIQLQLSSTLNIFNVSIYRVIRFNQNRNEIKVADYFKTNEKLKF